MVFDYQLEKEGRLVGVLTWFCDDLKHDANEDTSTDVDKKKLKSEMAMF